jgi:cytosine/adenosine deaminase-related metal-dependent hydrolase
MPAVRLVAELALTPDGWRRDVAVTVAGGRVATVDAAGAPRPGDVVLRGRALLPGTVNTH